MLNVLEEKKLFEDNPDNFVLEKNKTNQLSLDDHYTCF